MKKLKLIALFAAVIVGLGLYRFLQELNKPQETPHTMVVVAAMNIPENTRITAEMVTLRSISDDSLPENYMVDTESVIGMVMTGDVYAGEQIIRDRLVRIGDTDTDRNTLAYAVTPGMRAMTIFVDQASGLENFLKPGNRVDVIANFIHETTRAVLNKEEELEWVQVSTTQLLAQNVQILAVETTMSKSGAEEYATVTLEVTPQDAMNISAVSWWGNLRLLLRSPLDDSIIKVAQADEKSIYGE